MRLADLKTPGDALVEGGWRTRAQLNAMTPEDERNTLIVELTKHTRQPQKNPTKYFQGKKSPALVGKAAILLVLVRTRARDEAALTAMSDADQRNALIDALDRWTQLGLGRLRKMGDMALVAEAERWLNESREVEEVIEFHWDVNQAKVIATPPEVLETQLFTNDSPDPETDTFRFTKKISNTSKFSHEHEIAVTVGVETTFNAGIPGLAKNETTVRVDASTRHTWNFGKEATTEQSYEYESTVRVPPHARIEKIASVTRAQLDVPYRAKVRLRDGSVEWLTGTWNGVSTVNLKVRQRRLARPKRKRVPARR